LFKRGTIIVCSLFISGVAGSAIAEDCFIKVRTGEARAPHVIRAAAPHRRTARAQVAHRPHHVRHIVRRARARPAVIATAEEAPVQRYAGSSFAQQTIPIYAMRPTSCDAQPPAALQSAPPAGLVTPTQRLLDELAGPAEPVTRVADAPDAPGGSAGGFSPGGAGFGPPSGGGGFLTPGGAPPIVGPGGPGVGPPATPPDLGQPPIITPPEGGQPPIVILPPEGGQPPTVTPIIDQPPAGPPVSPPPPLAAIPEPGTWSLMILGAAGVGAILRRRRASAARRAFEIIRKPRNNISW
jgi:hypothetical protein